MTKLEQARQIMESIRAERAEPRIPFTLEAGEPGLCGSKLGGTPYLPRDMAWPLDDRGAPLVLLAQIDCAALAGLPDFPHTGLLQCFIGQTGAYGMDFDDQTAPKGFRVCWHEAVDPSVTAEAVESKRPPAPEDADSPLYRDAPCRICFGAPELQAISGGDFRLDGMFTRAWNARFPAEPIREMWDVLQDIDEDDIEDLLNPEEDGQPWHQLGGYPYFTQSDPRDNGDGSYQDLDVVLFQADSDSERGRDFLMWGDCGVGNFFISREALKKRDFSRVAYNWDCC